MCFRYLVEQRDMDPAARFHHLQLLQRTERQTDVRRFRLSDLTAVRDTYPDFLQVVEVVAHSDGDLAGGVALVRFVIGVNAEHLHRGSPPGFRTGTADVANSRHERSAVVSLGPELYVDQVRLRAVRLPVRLQVVVPQLIHAEPCRHPGFRQSLLVCERTARLFSGRLPGLQEDSDHTAWEPISRTVPVRSSCFGSAPGGVLLAVAILETGNKQNRQSRIPLKKLNFNIYLQIKRQICVRHETYLTKRLNGFRWKIRHKN